MVNEYANLIDLINIEEELYRQAETMDFNNGPRHKLYSSFRYGRIAMTQGSKIKCGNPECYANLPINGSYIHKSKLLFCPVCDYEPEQKWTHRESNSNLSTASR